LHLVGILFPHINKQHIEDAANLTVNVCAQPCTREYL